MQKTGQIKQSQIENNYAEHWQAAIGNWKDRASNPFNMITENTQPSSFWNIADPKSKKNCFWNTFEVSQIHREIRLAYWLWVAYYCNHYIHNISSLLIG